MYTNDPFNNLIDALRLEFGDIDPDFPRISNEAYQYYIDKYPTKPKRLKREIAMAILAYLTAGVRERSGQEERYGSEEFKNYKDFLEMKVADINFSGICPIIYVGGVDRETIEYYETHPDFVDSIFFRGYHSRKPIQRHARQTDQFGLSNPEERDRRGF